MLSVVKRAVISREICSWEVLRSLERGMPVKEGAVEQLGGGEDMTRLGWW